jgi:hypothetical protein
MSEKVWFVAKVSYGMVLVLSGTFDTEDEAKAAYKKLMYYHGEDVVICETIYG